MASELIAGLSIFKSLYDSAKALKDINDSTVRNTAVIELQEKILAARAAQADLLERVSELKTEVVRLKDWEAEKKRYKLAEIGPGVFALSLQESMRNGAPLHKICADCAANGKKFYLQAQLSGPYLDRYKCNGCGFEIDINKGTPPQNWGTIDADDE